MKDLNILWLGRNDIGRLASAMTYFRLEVARQAEVVFNGKGHQLYKLDVPKLVSDYGIDVIVLRGQLGKWLGLPDVSIPKVLIRGDPHSLLKDTADWCGRKGVMASCHIIYGLEARRGVRQFKKLVSPQHVTFHLPFSVPSEIYKDYGFEREYDMCLLGRMGGRTYPVRAAIARAMLHDDFGKDYKVFHVPRPRQSWGWKPEIAEVAGLPAFEEYAKAIARCKMMAVGASVYMYAVAKFFECMGVGTLVVSNSPSDAELLHFKPDWNFVEVNKKNCKEKIAYYHENEGEARKIAERGFRTVMEYHTCELRASQFLQFLETLI